MPYAIDANNKIVQFIICTVQRCWMLAAIVAVLTLAGCASHAARQSEALDEF
jgi:outer membrane murein-binding lipoprotein Lpp